MGIETLERAESLALIEKKLVKTPIETRTKRPSPIGLSNVVGAHGTHVEAVLDLARYGRFRGGTDPAEKFFVSLNQRSKDLQVPDQTVAAAKTIDQVGLINPIGPAVEYAGSASFDREDDNAGAVILFGRKIVDLIEEIQIGGTYEPEPEAILSTAPPIESITRIYAVDQLAFEALSRGLKQIRSSDG